jgi:putative ABC transport system ATP-binding protein
VEVQMSNNQTLMKLEKVNKVFLKGSIDEVKALDNVRLDVNAEDFITVIGSNGAGKTTLLNVIAGVYPPEKGGKITINDQNPHTGTAAKMSIEENLSLAMLRGQSRGLRIATNKKRRELFRSVLAPLGLGLEDRLSAMVGTLSGGQRQSLALVMATISKPSLLLLDEHVATLDPKTNRIVLELSEMIVQKEKMTTIMVTHNMDHALRYGNRLIMMHKGRIIVDIHQEKKSDLSVKDLIVAFERASGERFADDTIMLRNSNS